MVRAVRPSGSWTVSASSPSDVCAYLATRFDGSAPDAELSVLTYRSGLPPALVGVTVMITAPGEPRSNE